ncbi:MAG: hypothetical protein WKF73_17120 [Nocardioidaceae bacterium]
MPAVACAAVGAVPRKRRRADQALQRDGRGAFVDLKALHRELDEAVADCYGWPRSIAQDDKELVERLTDLNRQIVEGERDYDPFS